MRKIINDNSLLNYPGIHNGKQIKDIPCSYLLMLYNDVYDLPKKLVKWLDANIEYLEKAAFDKDATLFSYYESK